MSVKGAEASGRVPQPRSRSISSSPSSPQGEGEGGTDGAHPNDPHHTASFVSPEKALNKRDGEQRPLNFICLVSPTASPIAHFPGEDTKALGRAHRDPVQLQL